MIAVDLNANVPETSVCKTFNDSLVERAAFCQKNNPEGFVHLFLVRGPTALINRFRDVSRS